MPTYKYLRKGRRDTKEPLTSLLVDLDRFKEVNTRIGYFTGDFVLAEIAGLLRSSTRGSNEALN
jgi:diguanylate cyclase (GGDEF)-like protein